ncbi:MAG: hypothetical protein ACLQM6_05835 [Acidobacteriaceae bacterium]
MKDEVLGTTTAQFRVRTAAPCVVRLPDGHVQMTGDSARFPETCPRCGSAPANTMVKLRLTKPIFKINDGIATVETNVKLRMARMSLLKNNNRGIKIPFCRRCGWTIKVVQYLPAILGGAVMVFLGPVIEHSHPRQFPWYSSGIAVIAGALTAGLIPVLFEYLPRLFIAPGVKIVAATKGSVELVFDDPMYAEKFVLLNR